MAKKIKIKCDSYTYPDRHSTRGGSIGGQGHVPPQAPSIFYKHNTILCSKKHVTTFSDDTLN